jgi:hypothetical protein
MLIIPAPVLASAQGNPSISIFLPEDRVSPGDEATLSFSILNGGEISVGGGASAESRVTTARDVKLTLSPGTAPIRVLTGTVPVGNVAEGESEPIPVKISVNEGANPGTYSLSVEVEYIYTSLISTGDVDSPGHYQKTNTVTQNVNLIIEPKPSFEIDEITLGPVLDGYGPLNVILSNDGSESAMDATLTITSESSQLTFSGAPDSQSASAFIGDISSGDSFTVPFEARLVKGSMGITHPVSLSISYTDEFGESQQSKTIKSGVSPISDSGRFSVISNPTNLSLDQAADISFTITNNGEDAVSDARVLLQSTDPKLSLGGSQTAESVIGNWPSSVSKIVSFKGNLEEGSNVRPYPVIVEVLYKSSNNSDRTSYPVTVGVTPLGEQSFSVTDVSTNLSVGSEGDLSATLVNNGPQSVENAVIVFTSDLQTISSLEEEYAVGSLSAGDFKSFKFSLDVSESADEGQRQISLSVRYRDSDGKSHISDPIDVILTVSPEVDAFEVSPINSTFSPGGNGLLVLKVTNVDDETLTDISAKVFPESPITAGDDTAFIPKLSAGESTEIVFDISLSGTALDKIYPLDLDFQYDTKSGDTLLSDTYQIPVEVSSSVNGGQGIISTFLLPLVAIIVVAVGGVYFYRRRQNSKAQK